MQKNSKNRSVSRGGKTVHSGKAASLHGDAPTESGNSKVKQGSSVSARVIEKTSVKRREAMKALANR